MTPVMSRRAFTGILGLAVSARASSERLDIGVGTFSYHTLTMDAMIEQLRQLDIRRVEMSRGEFMLMKPPSDEMCRSAREKFDRAGIRCVSYYCATIKNAQDVEFAMRFARLLGASNVSGDASRPLLRLVDERFTREGLTFGIHNHWFKQKFDYESVEDVLRGLDGLSNTMGATLDVGQMAACGHDPVDAVRRLAPRLRVVHLKDVESAGAEHNVLLGHGVANIPGVMKELKAVGFRGLVAIEYEKDGNSDEDMRRLVRYARERA